METIILRLCGGTDLSQLGEGGECVLVGGNVVYEARKSLAAGWCGWTTGYWELRGMGHGAGGG